MARPRLSTDDEPVDTGEIELVGDRPEQRLGADEAHGGGCAAHGIRAAHERRFSIDVPSHTLGSGAGTSPVS